jgi:hypothetical protein
MIDAFDHVGEEHKCNVCSCEFSDEEGGVLGYFGILPVAFCPMCFSSICDMVEQDKDWQGLTDEEIDTWNLVGHESLREFVRAIEAKLKEKNA